MTTQATTQTTQATTQTTQATTQTTTLNRYELIVLYTLASNREHEVREHLSTHDYSTGEMPEATRMADEGYAVDLRVLRTKLNAMLGTTHN